MDSIDKTILISILLFLFILIFIININQQYQKDIIIKCPDGSNDSSMNKTILCNGKYIYINGIIYNNIILPLEVPTYQLKDYKSKIATTYSKNKHLYIKQYINKYELNSSNKKEKWKKIINYITIII